MTESLQHTPLHAEHLALRGKMVPFAGYEMPIQYPTGITSEHRAVRNSAGLFDVSHMGEIEVSGPGALELVQWVTTNDAARIAVGQAQYTALVNEQGGVLDDLLVYRFKDRWMLVANAANRARVFDWVSQHSEGYDVEIVDRSDEISLLALQGPRARAILAGLTDTDLDAIAYYHFAEGAVAGVEAVISATGYTGEDGFELYLPADGGVAVWKAIMEAGADHELLPAGLGARDTLRLEMGYSLYGNELGVQHTALESGLGWITKLDKSNFIGREALRAQKERGLEKSLVGLELGPRDFPRAGYPIKAEGRTIGEVTSGMLSPMLRRGIALGYVESGYATPGTELGVEIRGADAPATVKRPPFHTEGSLRR